jgi:hypothetical protein
LHSEKKLRFKRDGEGHTKSPVSKRQNNSQPRVLGATEVMTWGEGGTKGAGRRRGAPASVAPGLPALPPRDGASVPLHGFLRTLQPHSLLHGPLGSGPEHTLLKAGLFQAGAGRRGQVRASSMEPAASRPAVEDGEPGHRAGGGGVQARREALEPP